MQSEEEIINNIKTMLEKNDEIFDEVGTDLYFSKPTAEVIQGLLDLYNKEKEKNEKLEKEIYNIKQLTTFLDGCIMTDEILNEFKLKKINDYNFILAGKQYFDKGYFKENYISKDKIREKIKELEKPIEEEIQKSMDKRPTVALNIYTFCRDELKELLGETDEKL